MAKYNHKLSLTTVLRFINERLGASVQELELDEHEMMQVVLQNTIPTFSKYYPFMPLVRITQDDLIDGTTNEYRIPNPWNLNITDVHKIYQNNNWYCGIAGGSGYIPFTDPIYSQLSADRTSMTVLPILFDYENNRIRIRNNGVFNPPEGYLIQIKATQPSHLLGIPYNLREDFLNLAYYDVLTAYYPIRNRFSNLSTAYASVQFFMDEVNGAKQLRDEVLQKIENEFLFSGQSKKIWIL